MRDGVAVRPARGLYQRAEAVTDARHTLAEASALFPGASFISSRRCVHDLTLQMPSAVWLAIGRAAWKPTLDRPAIRFVRFSGRALAEGIEIYAIEGVDVAVFEPAERIADFFRYRNEIGLDIALEGLRAGLRRRLVTPDQLWRYRTAGRVWSVLRPYVEALIADCR